MGQTGATTASHLKTLAYRAFLKHNPSAVVKKLSTELPSDKVGSAPDHGDIDTAADSNDAPTGRHSLSRNSIKSQSSSIEKSPQVQQMQVQRTTSNEQGTEIDLQIPLDLVNSPIGRSSTSSVESERSLVPSISEQCPESEPIPLSVPTIVPQSLGLDSPPQPLKVVRCDIVFKIGDSELSGSVEDTDLNRTGSVHRESLGEDSAIDNLSSADIEMSDNIEQ